MDRGDCFLMGNPKGKKKHLWTLLSDVRKHGGSGIIVNFSTNKIRSGGECPIAKNEHRWFTETTSWVCFGDAQLISPDAWVQIQTGITIGFIVPEQKISSICIQRIIEAAKTSKAFPPKYLPYLD
jgi:hypothetical protein